MNTEFNAMDKLADQAWADATSSRRAMKDAVSLVMCNNPIIPEHITACMCGEITAEQMMERVKSTIRQTVRGWARDKYIKDTRPGFCLGLEENSQYMRRLP